MLLMPSVRLYRIEESCRGTFGVLTICETAFCVTLELPDRRNRVGVSNIPASQYLCERIESPKFGETFEVTSVTNRSMILFHKGNTVRDSRGCIILAQHFGKLCGDRAVLNSGATFKRFMDIFKGIDQFPLTVKDVF